MKSKGTWAAFQQKPKHQQDSSNRKRVNLMVTENILGKVSDKVNSPSDWGNSLKIVGASDKCRPWRRKISSGEKVGQNTRAPSASKKKKIKPVSTTEKQSMAYVTVKNIENETSHLEADWTLFVLKELIDNAWDWINDEYPAVAKAVRKIGVRIWLTHEGEEKLALGLSTLQ